VYRALDHRGQVIDVYVSARRDTAAATRFFRSAIAEHGPPVEVATDVPGPSRERSRSSSPVHVTTPPRYTNYRVETDHKRLKARLRPMRGLKRDRTTNVVIAGHAFIRRVSERLEAKICRRRRAEKVGPDASPSISTCRRRRSTGCSSAAI